MAIIESRYGSKGDFKSIIKMLAIMGTFTLLDVNCKDEITYFFIHNFKLNKVELPWMYEPMGKFT